MFPIQDQISSATRSSLESQATLYAMLASKTFESLERLVSLNVSAAKASLQESSDTFSRYASAKDPQEFFSLTVSQAQPTVEKALSYGRHLANITSSTHIELAKAAETQASDINRKLIKLVDDTAKVAPPGSENLIGMVKSALELSGAGYEQWSHLTQQTFEALGLSVNSAVAQIVPVTVTQEVRKGEAATVQ